MKNKEKIIMEYMSKHKGEWIRPSRIAREADNREHTCSWASHICLKLYQKGLPNHNIEGSYQFI